MDGMPFVGRASSSTDHLYVAAEYNAWGMTNGTAAGMILCDLISGRDNPWAQVFDPTRLKPLTGAKSFVAKTSGPGPSWWAAICRGSGARWTRCRPARPPSEAEWRAHRRFPRRAWGSPCGLRGVHSYGLRAGLERGGPDLGLLVPRLPLRPGRRHPPWSRDDGLETNSPLLIIVSGRGHSLDVDSRFNRRTLLLLADAAPWIQNSLVNTHRKLCG